MGLLNWLYKKKESMHQDRDKEMHIDISGDVPNLNNKEALYGLNQEQINAVMYKGKHLLVLAGAGTGKTKTIISRARYLIDSGVAPHRILILSFTRKSANEIVGRIKSHNNNLQGLSGQTFHSWCFSIIKSNPSVFNNHNFTCLDEEDRESAIKLLCGKNFKDNDNNIEINFVFSQVTFHGIRKVISYFFLIPQRV